MNKENGIPFFPNGGFAMFHMASSTQTPRVVHVTETTGIVNPVDMVWSRDDAGHPSPRNLLSLRIPSPLYSVVLLDSMGVDGLMV